MSNAVELAEEYVADSLLYGTAYSDENTYILAQAVIDLSARVEELEGAGDALLKAKEYKMLHGKDESYEKQKTIAWIKLAKALELAPAAEKMGE